MALSEYGAGDAGALSLAIDDGGALPAGEGGAFEAALALALHAAVASPGVSAKTPSKQANDATAAGNQTRGPDFNCPSSLLIRSDTNGTKN